MIFPKCFTSRVNELVYVIPQVLATCYQLSSTRTNCKYSQHILNYLHDYMDKRNIFLYTTPQFSIKGTYTFAHYIEILEKNNTVTYSEITHKYTFLVIKIK